MKSPPKLIAIDHDDYHAKYVGRTADGRQFFATTPFVPLQHEFDALYIFDADGNLLEAQIDDLGTRAELEADIEAARRMRSKKLAELGKIKFCRIKVKPFAVERFGVSFGLILNDLEQELEGDEDPEIKAEIARLGWDVTAQPGDYMAFYAPWNSGQYDT